MAITKTIEEDKIEIVGDYKSIQVRTATIIKEDGTEISRSYHRKSLQCGSLDATLTNFIETNIDSESTEVKAIAAAVWTQSVKDAWKAYLIANKPS